MTTDWKWVGAALRERRLELGKTQQWVADRTEITKAQVSNIEKGRNLPPLPTLERLATALNWEMDLRFGPRESLDLSDLTPAAREAIRALVQTWKLAPPNT